MENQIICPNCSEEYHDNNLPRLLIGCGHTFCQACLLSFIQQKDGYLCTRCPEDDTEHQIKQRSVSRFPKNLALIKVIESKKDCLSFKQNEINVSKITKNSSIHEQEDTNELINMMDVSHKTENSPQSHTQKIKQEVKIIESKRQLICPVHRKPMDIVCTVDLQKICASCAIFGEHKGHDFKSLEEVSQIQNEYVSEITAIIQQKQKLQTQLSCNQTKTQIIGLLTSKRLKLRQRILEQYQKLETRLQNKKKEVLKKLDEVVKKQEINIKNCIKFNDQLIQSYEKWYMKSDSQLKILEEHDFQAKLILLFQGKNIDGDLVAEGHELIQSMKSQEENIFNQVEKKLEDLSINIKEDIYQYVDDFITVNSENKKQIIVPVKMETSLQLPLSHNLGNNGKTSMASSKIRAQITERRAQPAPVYEINQNAYLLPCQSANVTHHLEESLLQKDDQIQQPDVVEFSLRMSEMVFPCNRLKNPPLSQRLSIQPNIETPIEKGQSKLKGLKSPVNQPSQIKIEKMTKKRLAKMKLPQRYQKIVQSLLADSIQILDLTNAEIGDSNMAIICQNLANSKVRTLKLIRNKLTDEGIIKILPYCSQITVLNISQNLLTDNILDILHENKKYLGNIRTVILSQNKIVQRKNKVKIDKLKKLDWNVSI